MAVVSVSMSEELRDRLDTFAETHGYTGRSEVVREAARSLLGEFEEKRFEDRALLGVVTATFPVESATPDGDLLSLRQEHEHLVASNVHSRITGQYCVELFVLEGQVGDVSAFIRELRARCSPAAVDYSLVPVDEGVSAGDGHDRSG